PLAAARVAEAWNGLNSLRRGLGPAVSLIRIVPVHSVAAAKSVIDIQRELVVSYRSNAGAAKCARTTVRQRYQREQFLHGRGGDRSTLSVRQTTAVESQGLTMLEAFVTEEEKCPVFHDRPTYSSAILIAAKRRLRDIEEIPCIQGIVAEIVEHLSVETI